MITKTDILEEPQAVTQILERFLRENTSPESTLLYLRLCVLCTDQGIEDFEEQYTDLLFLRESEDLEDSTVLGYLYDLAYSTVIEFLNNHEIAVDPEITLARALDIAESLVRVEDFEDSEAICRILESDDSNEELLSDILALQGVSDYASFLLDIHNVSDALILRIRDLHQPSEEQELYDKDINEVRAYRLKLRDYTKFLKTTNIRVVNMVRAGMPLGLRLESYITRLSDVLVRLPDTNVAVELFALSLICEDERENALELLEPIIDRITDDPVRVATIHKTLTNIIRRYQQA